MAILRHSDVHKHSTTKWLLLLRHLLYSVLCAGHWGLSLLVCAWLFCLNVTNCLHLTRSMTYSCFFLLLFVTSTSICPWVYCCCCCCCFTYKPHPHVFTISVRLSRIPHRLWRKKNAWEISHLDRQHGVCWLLQGWKWTCIWGIDFLSVLWEGDGGLRAKSPAVDTHSHGSTGCYSIVRLVSLLETRE